MVLLLWVGDFELELKSTNRQKQWRDFRPFRESYPQRQKDIPKNRRKANNH